MENRVLADRLSDAFMYIIPAISIVFAVVGLSIILRKMIALYCFVI